MTAVAEPGAIDREELLHICVGQWCGRPPLPCGAGRSLCVALDKLQGKEVIRWRNEGLRRWWGRKGFGCGRGSCLSGMMAIHWRDE